MRFPAIWALSFVLAPFVAILHVAGLSLAWSVMLVAVPALILLAMAANGKRGAAVALIVPVIVALGITAGVAAASRASGPPPAPQAMLVHFEYGQYTSYGNPSFTVTVDNGNDSPVTVHTVTVRFTDEQGAAHLITDVTEQASATVAGGQAQQLSFAAPPDVVNTGVLDRNVGVTVTDWS
jgi:hypothetical protein